MDLMSMILNANGGRNVREMAGSLGLDEGQVSGALAALLPALSQGLKRNASQPGGVESLLGALAGGHHQRYLEDPSTLARGETIQDGNAILGHILGSKEVSREVAGRAAATTGIGADVLKKMLPMVAALVMGAMSRKAATSGAAGAGARQAPSGDLLGTLGSLLDADRDGSVADDLLGMARKLF